MCVCGVILLIASIVTNEAADVHVIVFDSFLAACLCRTSKSFFTADKFCKTLILTHFICLFL